MAGPIYGSGFLELSPSMSAAGLKGFSSGLSGAMKGVGVLAAGVFAASFGVALKGVKAFAGLEQSMNEVFTLLPGISGAAMDEMTGQVRDFSKEFAVLPDEVVPALYQAISAGVPKDNVFDFLEIAQRAAIGGVSDLETAVDGISSVVNAYGSDVLSAAEASDLMFTAVRLGKTDFNQLSSSIFNVAPIASAVGVGFDEVAASLAVLTGMGTPTSVAATQMRAAISEMAKEGTKANKAFQEVAGVGLTEFIDMGFTFEEALGLMTVAAEDMGVSVLDLFGSVEAGSAVLALTGKGADAFSDALAEMGASAGATDAAYAQMDQGLSRTWDRIKVTFNDAFLEIGQRLAPFAQKFGDFFAERLPGWIDAGFAWFDKTAIPALQKLVGWFNNLGGVSGTMDKLSGKAQGLGSSLALMGGPLFLIAKELFPLIRPLLDAIIPPLAKLANALAPALADILGWLVDNVLPGFVSMLEAVIGWITDNKGFVIAIGAAVVAFKILTTVMAVNPFILLAGAVIAIAALIITNWDKITAFLSRVWDWIKNAASAVGDWLKNAFRTAVEFVTNLFLNFHPLGLIIKHFDKIKEIATGVKDWIVDKFNAVVEFFTKMPERISKAVSGLWDGLKNAFRNAVNWVIDKWNNFRLEIKLPSILGGGTIGIDTPNIPRLHEGGLVPGRPGQEMLAILEAGERVLSAAEVAGGSGGHSITIHTVNAGSQLAREVGRELAWADRAVGV